MTNPATIALLLFDDVDLLDVGGPYEVFLTANRLAERAGGGTPFHVTTVALEERPVTAYGGLTLHPQGAVGSAGDLDVLLVPGAVDIDAVLEDERLVRTVATYGRGHGVVASVCTGAFLLAAAGLLTGRPYTTHVEDLPLLAQRVDDGTPREDVRWVDDGDVVTAGGLSSGIAMALHLVERLTDRYLAESTAEQIDYVWTEDR